MSPRYISGHKHGSPSWCSIHFTGSCCLFSCIVYEYRDCNILCWSSTFHLIICLRFCAISVILPFQIQAFPFPLFCNLHWFGDSSCEDWKSALGDCSLLIRKTPGCFRRFVLIYKYAFYCSESRSEMLPVYSIRYINRQGCFHCPFLVIWNLQNMPSE